MIPTSPRVFQTNKIVEIMENQINQMATCSKCGASIKYPVTISGKIYGTSCAESVLGVRLPKGFSGDAGKYKAKNDAEIAERQREFAEKLESTKRDWWVNEYFHQLYFKASNEWEQDFVRSVGERMNASLMLDRDQTDFESVKNSTPYFYSFMTSDLAERFNQLSAKQKSILERINQNPSRK